MLGLTLLEGRLLERRDALTENLESVVVDRAWARRFFPNGSAVGKRFREGGCTTCPWTSVVGVVTDVKYLGLDAPDEGTVYSPMSERGPDAVHRGSHAGVFVHTAACAAANRAGARPVRAALERRDNGRSRRGVAREAAIAVVPGRGLRAGGARAVGGRHRRRDGELRAAAPQGHQHPHGPRRQRG